jgi:hypothetical protein
MFEVTSSHHEAHGVAVWDHVTCRPPLSDSERVALNEAGYFCATDGHGGECTIICTVRGQVAPAATVRDVLERGGRIPARLVTVSDG